MKTQQTHAKIYWRELPADSQVAETPAGEYYCDNRLVYWHGHEAGEATFWLGTHLSAKAHPAPQPTATPAQATQPVNWKLGQFDDKQKLNEELSHTFGDDCNTIASEPDRTSHSPLQILNNAVDYIRSLKSTQPGYADKVQDAVDNAQRLADALAILTGCSERGLDQSATHDGLSNCKAIADAREALAQWENAQDE